MQHINKTSFIGLRVKEDEYDEIKEKADYEKISISEYVRRTALERPIVHKNREDIVSRKQLTYEINKIGVNINQIVKDFNSQFYDTDDKRKLDELMQHVIDIFNEYMRKE